MRILGMDTAYKQLVLGLYEDGKLIDGCSESAFKKQSEELFPRLNELLRKNGWTYKDLDGIVITDGPGSYTGIRIAMTAAKVLASQLGLDLYTISTMQLYAGKEEAVNVILDSRGGRVYAAHLENGQGAEPTQIVPLTELEAWLEARPGRLVGDTYILEQESEEPDFLQNIIDLQPDWVKAENVHALTPDYLKDSSAYKA